MVDNPEAGRHLLVASTGGHLAQLAKWSVILDSSSDSLWVTFASPQSESLLIDRRVLFVPYIAPRDLWSTTKAFVRIMREIDWRAEQFTSAITTGAAVGLAGLAAARLHRVPSYYFESVSRVQGPSLTGRLASLDPGIHAQTQYEHWARGPWQYRGSLFDRYTTTPTAGTDRPRIFVTLGTIRPYRFDAIVDAVLSTGLTDETTVWQLGTTGRTGLPGKAVSQLSHDEFDECARRADVVITHAGVGTIMHLLEMGICPIVVPRRMHRKEHVDDHQTQIAALLTERGIALVTEANELNREIVLTATKTRVIQD